jgi:uncharacterized membrane protein
MLKRLIANLFTGSWHAHRALNKESCDRVTAAVSEAEKTTSAQIKVVVEASLHITDILRGQTARDRALEVFGLERIWDTSENNGILLYLLLAERDAEIVVDRGLHLKVDPDSWKKVCSLIENRASTQGLADALIEAVYALGEVARAHFHPRPGPNEIPDNVRVS